MKILYIASSADWHVDLWVSQFTDHHEVYLFSDKEDYLIDQPYKNVTIVHSGGVLGNLLNFMGFGSHKLFQLNKLISARLFGNKVNAIIDQFGIDVVHAHSLYYGYVASYVNQAVPVIFTPMGSDIILHAQSNKIYKYMAKHAFARSDVVTGDSVLLQNKGFNVGARKKNNYIIQNGVDTELFFPQENQLKQTYGVAADETLIFSPRGITPIYNIDVIVDSLSLLVEHGYNVKMMFSFAFGDDYSERIKQKIKQYQLDNHVIWLGRLTYIEMAEHYNAADIVVSVPSSDSSPKSVYEAMFCRKPVVVSDLEWSYELLNDVQCIERVEVRNAEAIYLAVAGLIDNPTHKERLAENAYDAAMKHYSYQENMKKMEMIMLDIVDAS